MAVARRGPAWPGVACGSAWLGVARRGVWLGAARRGVWLGAPRRDEATGRIVRPVQPTSEGGEPGEIGTSQYLALSVALVASGLTAS